MILWDVNLLIYAATARSVHHARCRDLLSDLLAGDEPFALYDSILAAVVRITTNAKAFSPPASVESAFAFCGYLLQHPRTVLIAPGPRHWSLFADLVARARISGSDTTDAFLAALAIEHGATWWSSDSDFERFDALRWHNPLA